MKHGLTKSLVWNIKQLFQKNRHLVFMKNYIGKNSFNDNDQGKNHINEMNRVIPYKFMVVI